MIGILSIQWICSNKTKGVGQKPHTLLPGKKGIKMKIIIKLLLVALVSVFIVLYNLPYVHQEQVDIVSCKASVITVET